MAHRVAIVVALGVVGFGVGRAWPPPATPEAAPQPPAVARRPSAFPSSADAPAPAAADHVLGPDGDDDDGVLLGRRVEPAFRRAWRADPRGADRSRVAVLEVLERRRRSHDAALRACLRTAGVHGLVKLQFDVAVDATGDRLQIGDAAFVEVTEGPPVAAAAVTCLEQLLAGADSVASHGDARFLADYHGVIDYVAGFAMP
jgi:hypothetical protein